MIIGRYSLDIFSVLGDIVQIMGRKKTRIILSEAQRAELRRLLRTVKDEREKERLRLVVLAASGEYTLEEMAEKLGRVRATIQNWLAKFNTGGIKGILERDTSPGSVSPISSLEIQKEMRAGIETGRWRSAGQVAAWLREKHGIKRATKSIYYWLSKKKGRTSLKS